MSGPVSRIALHDSALSIYAVLLLFLSHRTTSTEVSPETAALDSHMRYNSKPEKVRIVVNLFSVPPLSDLWLSKI